MLEKNQYGQYLKDVLDGKYVDILRQSYERGLNDGNYKSYTMSN